MEEGGACPQAVHVMIVDVVVKVLPSDTLVERQLDNTVTEVSLGVKITVFDAQFVEIISYISHNQLRCVLSQ